uniref:Uncharacterized protein n=1 Tax=Zea mays TaxID=4577 RepID=B4G032_MAIZE|nr:unknown [Zea mays]
MAATSRLALALLLAAAAAALLLNRML